MNVKFVPDFGPRLPVAAVVNNTLQAVSDDSSATETVVAIAAVPLVSWFHDVLTPGRFILPVPSNDTPPMFLAVSRAVAVAAFPVQDPDEPLALPVTLPVKAPANVPDRTSVFELNVSPLAVLVLDHL